MAIAGVFAVHAPQDREPLRIALGSMPQILEIAPVDDNKLAITLEAPAFALTSFLKQLGEMDSILNLEVIYVNYEDDLDRDGYMDVPPEARKYE